MPSHGICPAELCSFPPYQCEDNIRFGHKVKKKSFQDADAVVNQLCEILKNPRVEKKKYSSKRIKTGNIGKAEPVSRGEN